MSFTVAISAGLAVAASVGPAKEWRSALESAPEMEPVDRSCLITTEGGARGGIVPGTHYEGLAKAHVNMGMLGENIYQNGRAVHVDSSLWREPIQTRITELGRLEKAALARNLVRASLGRSHQSHSPLTMEELRELNPQVCRAFCREGYCKMGLGSKDLLGHCDLVPDPNASHVPDPLLVDDDRLRQVGVERFAELMAQSSALEADAYLSEYVAGEPTDSEAILLLGLRQLSAHNFESGLKSLSRASQILAPIDGKKLLTIAGVTESQVADVVVRLMNQRGNNQTLEWALGLATAAHVAGRPAAAKKLLDLAVKAGFDRSEAVVLTETWDLDR